MPRAMEMEAFTGKLHAYLRSVSTRVRLSWLPVYLSACLSVCLPVCLSVFCAWQPVAPAAARSERQRCCQQRSLLHPRV